MIRYLINLLFWATIWRLTSWFGFMPNNDMTGMIMVVVLPIVTSVVSELDDIRMEVSRGR